MSLRIRLYQLGVLLMAGAVFFVLLHWLVVQPPLIKVEKGQLTLVVSMVFDQRMAWTGYAAYHAAVQSLLGMVWALAASIAALLAIKVPDNIAVRRLAVSLALAAVAGLYIFFVPMHEPYRVWLHWQPTGVPRFLFDTLAFTSISAAGLLLVRFFMGYPRQILLEEWAEYDIRKGEERRQSLRGMRRWLDSKLISMTAASVREKAIERTRKFAVWSYRSSSSRWTFLACLVVGMVVAAADQGAAAGVLGRRSELVGDPAILLRNPGLLVPVLSLTMGLGLTLQCLHLHQEFALPDDRERWRWLAPSIEFIAVTSAIAWPVLLVGFALLVRFVPDALGGAPAVVLFMGPMLFLVVLAMLSFLAVLAASVFYRGAADPRLAMRKITVFGVVGIVLAFVFVLIERTVALQIAKALGLASETAILMAGAAVAATFGPMRNGAERLMNRYLARWLPLEHIVEGERKTLAIVIADLSGYTQLSSRDEKQAMLVAAAFQRQAERLATERNGRVVKSMGDAVLVAFESAVDAAHLLVTLPVEFAKAAQQIGVTPLPVHSGAHLGEVTVTADGDVYGQTVNLAARLQSAADSGQAMVSEAFASAAPNVSFAPVGARQFKNVPEPVPCLVLKA